MRLDSIQVGLPRTYGRPDGEDPFDRPWTSGILKEPVEGRVWASESGLTGDRQADSKHHGGAHRAALMYPVEHYPRWRAEWGRKDVSPGSFGDNLTVSGLAEHTTCIGDVFEMGEVRVEVSSPRSPCQNLARLHGLRDLVRVVRENHRHGWYVRVLREGWLEAGLPVRLVDRPYPQWTVVRAGEVKWARDGGVEEARLLAACPALIPEWRQELVARVPGALRIG